MRVNTIGRASTSGKGHEDAARGTASCGAQIVGACGKDAINGRGIISGKECGAVVGGRDTADGRKAAGGKSTTSGDHATVGEETTVGGGPEVAVSGRGGKDASAGCWW